MNIKQQTSGGLQHVCVTALGLILTVGSATPAHADTVTPPPVPAAIQVPGQTEAVFVGHAIGTQNYICVPASTKQLAWTLFTPQATLFTDQNEQLSTHYFSPSPSESGLVRATWQDSRDTSTVWGRAIASSSDPAFVAPGAIPWLLVEITGAQTGPTGGATIYATTYIQRLNTTGGVAPSTGCARPGDVGKKAFVPYTADYFFYQ